MSLRGLRLLLQLMHLVHRTVIVMLQMLKQHIVVPLMHLAGFVDRLSDLGVLTLFGEVLAFLHRDELPGHLILQVQVILGGDDLRRLHHDRLLSNCLLVLRLLQGQVLLCSINDIGIYYVLEVGKLSMYSG